MAALTLLPAFLALSLVSCGSVRFERAWERASEPVTAAATEQEPLRERWEGEWRSEWNGHSGGLRCLMWRVNEQHLHAWFLSTYARILSFEHDTLFHLEPSAEGGFTLSGSQDLGSLVGGVYTYSGSVDANSFRATYKAENGDHGVFEMKRLE